MKVIKKKKKKNKVDGLLKIMSKNNLEMPKESSISIMLGGQNSKAEKKRKAKIFHQ